MLRASFRVVVGRRVQHVAAAAAIARPSSARLRHVAVAVRAQSKASTIFERVGGKDAVWAAVDLFYTKVTADPRVSKFFTGVDMKRQRGKQFAFLMLALGGPDDYKGKSMYEAHKHLALTEEHFAAVAEDLQATLEELGLDRELVKEAMTVVASTHDEVLGIGH